jgi:hypothetical protein
MVIFFNYDQIGLFCIVSVDSFSKILENESTELFYGKETPSFSKNLETCGVGSCSSTWIWFFYGCQTPRLLKFWKTSHGIISPVSGY